MRKVVVTLVDDLDSESVAAETVSFGLDGVGYEIDLSESNGREWARRTGREVPARGRIPSNVMKVYRSDRGAAGSTAVHR